MYITISLKHSTSLAGIAWCRPHMAYSTWSWTGHGHIGPGRGTYMDDGGSSSWTDSAVMAVEWPVGAYRRRSTEIPGMKLSSLTYSWPTWPGQTLKFLFQLSSSFIQQNSVNHQKKFKIEMTLGMLGGWHLTVHWIWNQSGPLRLETTWPVLGLSTSPKL
jgi:hypothetical protein